MNKVALLCAGGSGGHVFPAEALALALNTRGWASHLVTDIRGKRFASTFPGDVSEITFRPPALRNPVKLALSLPGGLRAYGRARSLVSDVEPAIAIGFGGYPSLAPMFAALHKGVPTLLHEQNAVLGRANRLLSSRIDGIASGFDLVGAVSTVTGNPMRPAALEVANRPYVPSGENDAFNLLVFGGSQGALYFSEVVPEAVAALSEELRQRLSVTLQSRTDDGVDRAALFRDVGVEADVAPFFTDMPARIAGAQFVMGRAGASTVGEIALIGRPSLLVPLPYSLDGDQAANAASLARTGGTQVVAQSELSPERLTAIIAEAMANPATLAIQAEAAKQAGIPDAAERLADLVEATAS